MEQHQILSELARRELARREYGEYLALSQGKGWRRTALSVFLAETVQDFLETDTGHAYDILVIETPPQHGKSITVTETLPSWYLGRNPDKRVIVAGYSEDFAEGSAAATGRSSSGGGRTYSPWSWARSSGRRSLSWRTARVG